MINTLYIALFIILVAGIITLVVLLYREKFTPAPTIAALPKSPIPGEQNLILSDQINNDLIEWSRNFDDWLYKQG